jgi:hypothetical protein
MSAPPSQNRSNPSPVPGPSTATSTRSFWPRKASPASDDRGSTVEDPVTETEPEMLVSAWASVSSAFLSELSLPQAAPSRTRTVATMARGRRMPGVASR